MSPDAAPGGAPAIAVVMHDVSAVTLPAVERVLDGLRECSAQPLRLTHLVVPHWHGDASSSPRFERWLDDAVARGDELALHGYTHLDEGQPQGPIDRLRRHVYTAGEGEFAALSLRDAARRLRLGRQWFEAGGWPLAGFVAPAWLLSPGAWSALALAEFEYTCTLNRLVAMPQRQAWRCASFVWSTRSGWRRRASRLWNAMLGQRMRAAPLQRLELHPHDADDPDVRSSWQGLLGVALRQGRRSLTLREAVAELSAADAARAVQAQT